MKKILFFLFASSVCFAQTAALPLQQCIQGAVQAKTQGLASSNYLNGIIPSCTVTVYLTGTTTKATIYADAVNTPLANPFIASSTGQWLAYSALNQGYDVVLSGGIAPNTYPSPLTITGLYPGTNITPSGSYLPLSGGTLTGALNGTNGNFSGAVAATITNGLTNAVQLTGADIGAKINSFGTSGTLWIPDGTYNFSTPISVTQVGNNTLHIICASRNTILNYVGSGDAIYLTSGASRLNSVSIDNCTITGTGSAANAIHDQILGSLRLNNLQIEGFTAGAALLGQGMLGAIGIGNDFSGNKYGTLLEPDTVSGISSNANHFWGGSLQYNGLNLWDMGSSSQNDQNNTWEGVTMESGVGNAPQFLIEGAQNDAIRDGYCEFAGVTNSTSNLYCGVVGNLAGSGYGSNTTERATNFVFDNMAVSTPRAGATFTTAALLMENTSNAYINNLQDMGAPSYDIAFSSSANNVNDFFWNSPLNYQVAVFINPPSTLTWSGYGQVWGTFSGAFNGTSASFSGTVQMPVGTTVYSATSSAQETLCKTDGDQCPAKSVTLTSQAGPITQTTFAAPLLTLPTVPTNVPLITGHCSLTWSQGNAISTATLGMGMNNAPGANGLSAFVFVPPAIVATGNASAGTTISTTTPTSLSTAMVPVATNTTYSTTVDFSLQTGATNPVSVSLYIKTGNASDPIYVQAPSMCWWN